MDTTSQRVVAAMGSLAVILAGLAGCAGQVQGAQPSPVTRTAVMPSGTAEEVPAGEVVRKEDRDAARLATISWRVSAADQKREKKSPAGTSAAPSVKATRQGTASTSPSHAAKGPGTKKTGHTAAGTKKSAPAHAAASARRTSRTSTSTGTRKPTATRKSTATRATTQARTSTTSRRSTSVARPVAQRAVAPRTTTTVPERTTTTTRSTTTRTTTAPRKTYQAPTASARVAGSKATAPRVQFTPGKKVSRSCPMVNGSFQC